MATAGGRLDMWRSREVLGQLIRFGVTGVVVTLFYSAVYYPIATWGHRLVALGGSGSGGGGAVWPLIAVVVAFLSATAFGNVAHSRFSFKGHGSRDQATARRFFVVQSAGFALNAAFTWIMTGPLMHGATWWPLVPATLVTPLFTFVLQRNWVFR